MTSNPLTRSSCITLTSLNPPPERNPTGQKRRNLEAKPYRRLHRICTHLEVCIIDRHLSQVGQLQRQGHKFAKNECSQEYEWGFGGRLGAIGLFFRCKLTGVTILTV
ncbi:hypothetical protein M404DRAFT_825816 [Pisolithus tinctorius Marx 270]|uniref:Uncharacterized protein n=1 Tax=Pisolithus tinctorius Marx 270 TaxID=870435 RepID=A0A0C3NCP9_PISTI|nr:hypothetical protein M404DRAFT_825816 [Pisolithus tinctorius Marx 270]